MCCSVKIQTPDSNFFWKKELDEEEFQSVQLLFQSRCFVHIFPAALIPVRSDNCNNFCRDFFLPTFINHALKTQNLVCKIFTGALAILFDLATLPIRLLTCVPTILCNKKKEAHPLHKYLVEQENVPPELLQSEYFFVKQTWTTIHERQLVDEEGKTITQNEQVKHQSKGYVNLINIPIHEDFDNQSYIKKIIP